MDFRPILLFLCILIASNAQVFMVDEPFVINVQSNGAVIITLYSQSRQEKLTFNSKTICPGKKSETLLKNFYECCNNLRHLYGSIPQFAQQTPEKRDKLAKQIQNLEQLRQFLMQSLKNEVRKSCQKQNFRLQIEQLIKLYRILNNIDFKVTIKVQSRQQDNYNLDFLGGRRLITRIEFDQLIKNQQLLAKKKNSNIIVKSNSKVQSIKPAKKAEIQKDIETNNGVEQNFDLSAYPSFLQVLPNTLPDQMNFYI